MTIDILTTHRPARRENGEVIITAVTQISLFSCALLVIDALKLLGLKGVWIVIHIWLNDMAHINPCVIGAAVVHIPDLRGELRPVWFASLIHLPELLNQLAHSQLELTSEDTDLQFIVECQRI